MVRDSDWAFGVGVPSESGWDRRVRTDTLIAITGCILAEFAIKSGRRGYLYRTGPLEMEKEKEEDKAFGTSYTLKPRGSRSFYRFKIRYPHRGELDLSP